MSTVHHRYYLGVRPPFLAVLLAGCSLGLDLHRPGQDQDLGRSDAAPPDVAAAAPRIDAAPPPDAGVGKRPDGAVPARHPDAAQVDVGLPPDAAAEACDPRFLGPRCDDCAQPGLEGPECDRCVDVRRAPPDCEACVEGFGGINCAPVDDTAALEDEGSWVPAARMSSGDVPADAAAAHAAGCRLWGDNRGSGLASLLALTGPLDQQLRPDEDGDISIVLLLHLAGWDAGQTANEATPVDLVFYLGTQAPFLGAETFPVSRRSFVDEDLELGPLNFFPQAAIAGRRLQAGPSAFSLQLDIRSELPFVLRIAAAQVRGTLDYAPETGLAVQGRIEGYLTRSAVVDTVRQLQATCSAASPPATCETIALFAGPDIPPERGADTLAAFVGGYEARLDDAGPGRCDPAAEDDCNAVGVCLLFEATPATIVGVAP